MRQPNASSPPEAPDDPGRHETEAERNDRNMAELLQELRVAGLGVQVLFGFLLSLPFTARFTSLSGSQRAVYVTSLLLAALSTALLCAPVAYHRLVFRRHQKERVLRMANLLAVIGLGTVAIAISTAVALALTVVDRGVAVPVIVAVTVAVYGGLWFALPIYRRRESSRPDQPEADGRVATEPRAHR
jgi:hypothetical protein